MLIGEAANISSYSSACCAYAVQYRAIYDLADIIYGNHSSNGKLTINLSKRYEDHRYFYLMKSILIRI